MRIKICGITKLEYAKAAYENGASALGYIFYKKSKRYIKPESVKSIVKEIPPFVSNVGVFVNEDIDTVIEIYRHCGLEYAQIQGDESPEYLEKLNKNGVKTIRGFRIKDENSLKQIGKFKNNTFLIDAYSKNEYGGTGNTINVELAKMAKEYGNIILAGGVNSNNIVKLNNEIKPYAFDISSGVEKSPGIKDIEKIKELFRIIGGNNVIF